MALVKVLDKYDLQREFREYDRDYFSLEGYQYLLDLFEECDCGQNTDLDVIAICCDFTECADELSLWEDYNNIDEINECMSEDAVLDCEKLLDVVSQYTLVAKLDNGNVIYQNF